MAEGLRGKSHLRLGQGLNLDANRLTLEPGDALVARNCDRDHDNAIRKRRGSQREHVFMTEWEDGITRPTAVAGIYNHEWDDPCRGAFHSHLYALENGQVWRKVPGEPPAFEKVTGPVVENVRVSYADFETISGDTFIAIGKGRLRVYDGERMWWAGIATPAASIALTTPSGTSLTGTYSYRFTYIYRGEDNRFMESNPTPSDPINDTATVTSKDITVSWTAHPNSVLPGNGERVTGYRIYRTADQDSGGDPQVFLLVTEITDVTTTSYVDSTPDLELTDLMPAENSRNVPPDGTTLVKEYSGSLFCFGPKFNRLGFDYSEPGEYEAFPATNRTRLPESSTGRVTGAFKISGILGCTTEDTIYHVSGSNPRDFTHRYMTNYTGCLSPGSVKVLHNTAMLRGKHGFYSWNGASLNYLSEDIEDEVKGVPFDTARLSFAEVLTEYTHYYCSTVKASTGERVWWVYDISSEGYSAAANDEGGSTSPRLVRSWFEYTGMPAVAMGVVRQFTDREEYLEWADANGVLYRFDVGDTDDGRTIDLEYQYVFLPSERRAKNPPDRTFVVREVTTHTDEWVGRVDVALKYLRSHMTDFITSDVRYREDAQGDIREEQFRFAHNGSSAAVVRVRHTGPGTYRLLGVTHNWKPRSRRHQEI